MNNQIVLSSEQARELLNKHGAITMSGIESLLGKQPAGTKVHIKKVNKNLNEIKFLLKMNGIEFVEEYKFHDKRKFRFDIALPFYKIAIEYDGIMSKKSRHTTVTGFSMDQEKLNAATSLGWKVLRYSPLNFTQAIDDIRKLINEAQTLPSSPECIP